MDIWQIDKFLLFFIFFIPGFLSLKVYSLLVASEKRDFSKDLLEVFTYSSLNFALLSPLIIFINSGNFYTNHKIWYAIATLFTLFIMPICWPFLFVKITSWRPIAKFIVHPIQKPWDYVFGKKESFWVIVHLKDGKRVGGRYDTNSFASSFPSEEQIYIEEVWELDDKGSFIKPIERSKGIIILGNNILAIELFGDSKDK